METLGQKILRLRKAAGLSQERLGRRLGITQVAISKWESGEVNIPSNQIPALARVFMVAEASLFSDTIPAPPAITEADRRLACISLIIGAAGDLLPALQLAIEETIRAGSQPALNQRKGSKPVGSGG